MVPHVDCTAVKVRRRESDFSSEITQHSNQLLVLLSLTSGNKKAS